MCSAFNRNHFSILRTIVNLFHEIKFTLFLFYIIIKLMSLVHSYIFNKLNTTKNNLTNIVIIVIIYFNCGLFNIKIYKCYKLNILNIIMY
jgi:hypothetical protein